MNIERQIEFDKVKEIWAELAVTDWAKEALQKLLEEQMSDEKEMRLCFGF